MSRVSCLVIALVVAGCTQRQLGFPRIGARVVSPNGEMTAFVGNHLAVDPPAQSLRLATDGRELELERLGEDADWCNDIVWDASSRFVVFLVQDARAVVFTAGGRRVFDEWLVERDGYPTSHEIRRLRFDDRAESLVFVECVRPTRNDSARDRSCSPERRVRIPAL